MAGWRFSTIVIIVVWTLVHFLPRNEGPPVVNYDNTVHFNHDNLHIPSTKEELVQLVKSASEDVRKVRVIGSGHSWSQVAQSEDILISLHNYAGVVSVDVQEKTVTVKAGTKLKDVTWALEEYGLAMQNLGSISEQTAAGAISTGTHGTGKNYGNLATLVTKLEFISGEGEIITASADENPEIFKAAQVSIGMLGVITEVTFQCVDRFNLEETLTVHSLDYCLNNLPKLASSAEHVKFWIELHSNTCAVFSVDQTSEEPRDTPFIFMWNMKVAVYVTILWVASFFPQHTAKIMRLLFSIEMFPAHNRVDVSHRVFNVPHYLPNHHEGELVVSIEDCAQAIREVKRVVEKFEIPLNFVQEIRFVQADDIWLSPNYERNSCHITQTIYNPSEEHRLLYFYESYKALKKLSVRVHWGKAFQMSPAEVKAVYPKFEDFAKIQTLLDPKGIFLNELLRQTFGF